MNKNKNKIIRTNKFLSIMSCLSLFLVPTTCSVGMSVSAPVRSIGQNEKLAALTLLIVFILLLVIFVCCLIVLSTAPSGEEGE